MTTGELSTSRKLLDHGARFEVMTANPVYRQQLVQAGFQKASGERFVRYADNPSGVQETYENFSRHIEQILLQHAGIEPRPLGEYPPRVQALHAEDASVEEQRTV